MCNWAAEQLWLFSQCWGDSCRPVHSSSCFPMSLSGALGWKYRLQCYLSGNVSHMRYNVSGKNR